MERNACEMAIREKNDLLERLRNLENKAKLTQQGLSFIWIAAFILFHLIQKNQKRTRKAAKFNERLGRKAPQSRRWTQQTQTRDNRR